MLIIDKFIEALNKIQRGEDLANSIQLPAQGGVIGLLIVYQILFS